MMFSTSRPAAEPVSSDSATQISVTLRRVNRSSSVHRRHAGAVQALGGLPTVDDGVEQLGAVDHRHGADLLGRRLERDASIRLLVCRYPNVASRFHRSDVMPCEANCKRIVTPKRYRFGLVE